MGNWVETKNNWNKLFKVVEVREFRSLVLLLLFLFTSLISKAQSYQINLNYKNATLGSVLKDIGAQTSMLVVYSNEDVNPSNLVSIHVRNESLGSVLSKLLKGTNLSYSIEDNHIILSHKSKNSLEVKERFTIKGNVKDKKGENLFGVNISIKGTTWGATTDVDGNFSLLASTGDLLTISYIGFTTQTITIRKTKEFSIILSEDSKTLNEVVITALGIKRQQNALSYNIQEIESAQITESNEPNFVNSLTGKIAGVSINASSSGIGGATRIMMRGPKSINGNNNALYVIDGVPLVNNSNGETIGEYSMQPRGEGISDLNPEDIESISILTGAAAAALYGSSAANGAIIITTKSGKLGNAHVVISSNVDFMTPLVMPKFQNTYGNENGIYASWGPKLDTKSCYNPSDFFNTGVTIQNSVSLSLGNSKSQTYLSLATTNSDGIIPNNKYNRYNFTYRNSTSFFDGKMLFDMGLCYVIQNDRNMMAQGKYFNPLTAIYTFPRNDNFKEIQDFERYDTNRNINVQYWPYGDQGLNMQNPYWIVNRNVYENKKTRYMLNSSIKYFINSWLNFTGRIRVDNAVNKYTKKYYASTIGLFAGPKGFYLNQDDDDRQLYADAIANVNKKIADVNFSANIGTSVSYSKLIMFGIQGPLRDVPNFFSANNVDIQGRDAKIFDKIGPSNIMTPSVFANAEIGWKNMAFLTITGRNDWSSTLVNMPTKSFFYPSVGYSMLLNRMVSLPNSIPYLKVRVSWASVGSAIPPYLSIPTYQKDNSTGQWKTTTYMPIDRLYPERTESWEVGFNSKLWGNIIGLDFTLYKSNTTKQTFNMPISTSSGYDSWYVQTGNVQNTGVELVLKINKSWNRFSWNSSVVFSENRNKIIKLFDSNLIDPMGIPVKIDKISKGGIGSSDIILTEGGTIGDLYTKTELKKDDHGNILVDADGNLSVDANAIKKVGTSLPLWNLGYRNEFGWRGFSLGFLFSMRYGGQVISATQAVLDGVGVTKETEIARDNGGVIVNGKRFDAQKWYETVGRGGVFSHYVYSATNIRLQELIVGYSFPSAWFGNKMEVNLSLVGKNLWMIYNRAPFDPELTPSTGTFYQGIDYFMQPSLRKVGFSLKFQF